MNDFRADLHCHTYCSDGTCSPEEIVHLAQKKGLKGLSITDHDTFEAYKQAIPAAKAIGLPLISGIEFSTIHKEQSIHILAYSFPLDHPTLLAFCSEQQRKRLLRIQAILKLLAKEGMPVDEAEVLSLAPQHAIGRPHVAMAMMKRGYIKSIEEAFKYLTSGGSCFVMGSHPSVQEVLDLIRRVNGISILAHPMLIKRRKILHDLLAMPFDGIEGYYARFNLSQVQNWLTMAAKKNWIVTGGSDYHGAIKTASILGSSWTNEQTFNLLHDRYIQNNPIKPS